MADGLLDKQTFRQGQSQRSTVLSEAKENTIGVMITIAPYTLMSTELSEAYSVMPPLKGPDEAAPAYRTLLPGVVRGTFAITPKCDDPAAMLGWVDYLYSDEGGRAAAAGVEGVDYRWDGASWTFITDEFTPIDSLLRDRMIRTDNLTPGLAPADFERRTSLAIESRIRREGDAIRSALVTPYPMTWPTDASRSDEIEALQSRIGMAADEGIARFIDGETELNDSEWAAFTGGLRDLGADRLVELFQIMYDEQARTARD
jgi:putative aldouronate transport system substrate-binding protein